MSDSDSSKFALHDDDPKKIAHYRILRRLGQGGMGIVYLAMDETLNREVALKILPPEMAVREDLIDRFTREANAVSKLKHTSIVPIYEMGRDGAFHFFVMPFIKGISLSGFVQLLHKRKTAKNHPAKPLSGPITAGAEKDETSTSGMTEAATDLSRLLQIFETTAFALDHAHQQGIIHRDVKPSNILIDSDGHPHVLDFGLAKVVGLETQSLSGKILGTLPYMSPEQVSPNKGEVDQKADVYALGVTMYECVCGKRPFHGATTESLVFQILMKQPPTPRQHIPDLSKDIETIILKCMEKDPARRYATARELAMDLRRFREHRHIEARPVGKLGKALRWAELNRLLAFATASALIALVVLSTFLISNAYHRSVEEARMKSYRHHVGEARKLEVDRHEAMAARKDQAELVKRLEHEVPSHENATSLGKRELFVARAAIKKLDQSIAKLQGRIEYHLQRSREAVEPVNMGGEERTAMYLKLLKEATARQDLSAVAKIQIYLAESGTDSAEALTGKLTVSTEPPGARAVAYPLKDDIGGIRQLDQKASLDLGTTPVAEATLPPGSWLITLNKSNHDTVFLPVFIEPDQHWGDPSWHEGKFQDKDWTVRLPQVGEFDKKTWCFVPAGPYLATPEFFHGLKPPLEWRWEDSFLIGRQEVHFADYEDFLRLEKTRQELIKSVTENNVYRWLPRIEPWLGIFEIDGHGNLGPGKTYGELPPRPYSPAFVLTGLSLQEIEEFIRWFSEAALAKEKNARLPTASQWQKAARGVDGRIFPWGNQFDWSYTYGRYSREPTEGKQAWQYHGGKSNQYASDTSPYGCMDMAGNAAEWCSDGPTRDGFKDQHWVMGGSFGWNLNTFFTTWPQRSYPFGHVDIQFGFRLVRDL